MSRLDVAGWAITVMFVGTIGSQAWLQTLHRADVIQRATETQRFVVPKVEPARRGAILTADGKPLATNDPLWELSLDAAKVPNCPGFVADLSAATGISTAQIQGMLNDPHNFTWPNKLNAAQARAVWNVKQEWRADGLSAAQSPDRSYPMGPFAAGFVGDLRGGQPTEGIEQAFNNTLSGKDGHRSGFVDRAGNFLPLRSIGAQVAKVDGQDVVTTIDSQLQMEAAEVIKATVEAHDAVRGSAIIMDPKTGSILAMANWPSYNPQPDPTQPPATRWSDLDAAYMARVEPGSMFKLLTLAEGLTTGKVSSGFAFDCTGTLKINSKSAVRCDEEHGTRAHGEVDLAKAIAVSCNCSAATWAMEIGRDTFFHFLDVSGLLDRPSLGLPGEIPGQINRNDPAKKLQLADMGFGQSITVVPIAFADAVSAIGNGGVRMAPRLIQQVGSKVFPPVSLGQLFTPAASDEVRGFMKGVIDDSYGTGAALKIPGYEIAGKTGTAQIRNGAGGYVSNFVGFVPADSPKVLILVMVDHPRKDGYYGAAIAGPAFRQLALDVIHRLSIPPTESVAQNLTPVASIPPTKKVSQ